MPSVISKAFWGGVWGAALAPLLDRYRGATYWASWVLIGAVVLTLTALYVVSPLKGQPIPALWPRFYYALLVNGAWGFGTALFLGLDLVDHGRRCLRSVTAKAPAQLTAGSVSPQTLVRGSLSEATTGTFEAVGFAFIADAGDMCRFS